MDERIGLGWLGYCMFTHGWGGWACMPAAASLSCSPDSASSIPPIALHGDALKQLDAKRRPNIALEDTWLKR